MARKNKIAIKQGDIYMCDLSVDSIDHEQRGVRPVLVVSADIRNQSSPNVFVFPLTHSQKKFQPCHYSLFQEDYPFFNSKQQVVLCEEGRSISKKRLERFLGRISDEDLQNIFVIKEYVFTDNDKSTYI